MTIIETMKSRMARAGMVAAVCGALALGTGVAGTAMAQQQGGQGMEQAQQAQMRLQEIHQQLGELQQQTLEDNAGLRQEQEDLEEMAVTTMESMGHDPRGNIERLEELRDQLQAAEGDPEQQQSLFEAFQEERMALEEAQRDAMEDEAFMEAQQDFQDNLLAAMRADHPETDDLIAEFEEIQQEMMQMQQQGGGMQGGGIQ
ncbi:hypothetical protein ACN2MM_06470 [Alkalilimnicola ehrlichii MLHE-1]|uniref:Uncharacterized protein n=1 Tax=Alkalilimnicola ehrlichii (strain ATCC BAA-1101 / DSM 17681 / MLHE-1) TaxID=187272 RepID=Q0A9H4_ALKEH|nr:hypothetical protein [Alkalilimnicola ehrlichii]ABI56513.1 hypothetical protein Mlg_1164 [Alkalilimnicola ehrlichii MLHE-1]